MTINYQIRDEKLQYDINRETDKISALSSSKIHKHEYLTGEVILPPNQQQLSEQANFTYSSLGKAFEKQIKTIEEHEKTSRGFKGFKTKRTTKSIADQSDNSPSISKEIYDELIEERMGEILEMSREIKYDKLVYDFKGPTSSINFTKFGGPVYTYNQLKNGDKTLQQVEKEQEDFKIDLNEIASGNPKHKSDSHLYTIKNVKSLYSSRQKNIDLLNDMQKLNLNQFIDQNKMKEQEQDLKY